MVQYGCEQAEARASNGPSPSGGIATDPPRRRRPLTFQLPYFYRVATRVCSSLHYTEDTENGMWELDCGPGSPSALY